MKSSSLEAQSVVDIDLNKVDKLALDLNNAVFDSEKNRFDFKTVGYNFFIEGKWKALKETFEAENPKHKAFRAKVIELFEEEPESINEDQSLLIYAKKGSKEKAVEVKEEVEEAGGDEDGGDEDGGKAPEVMAARPVVATGRPAKK